MWSGKLNYEFRAKFRHGGGQRIREVVGNRYNQSGSEGMEPSLDRVSAIER